MNFNLPELRQKCKLIFQSFEKTRFKLKEIMVKVQYSMDYFRYTNPSCPKTEQASLHVVL